MLLCERRRSHKLPGVCTGLSAWNALLYHSYQVCHRLNVCVPPKFPRVNPEVTVSLGRTSGRWSALRLTSTCAC